MSALTEADRTILAATRFYCDCTDAYCSMRGELETAVEQILAAREAALLERLGDERVMEAARREFMRVNYPSPCDKAAMTAALAAVRAELLRQGGEE